MDYLKPKKRRKRLKNQEIYKAVREIMKHIIQIEWTMTNDADDTNEAIQRRIDGYSKTIAEAVPDVGEIDKILEKKGHIVDWGYRNGDHIEQSHYKRERKGLAKAIYDKLLANLRGRNEESRNKN